MPTIPGNRPPATETTDNEDEDAKLNCGKIEQKDINLVQNISDFWLNGRRPIEIPMPGTKSRIPQGLQPVDTLAGHERKPATPKIQQKKRAVMQQDWELLGSPPKKAPRKGQKKQHSQVLFDILSRKTPIESSPEEHDQSSKSALERDHYSEQIYLIPASKLPQNSQAPEVKSAQRKIVVPKSPQDSDDELEITNMPEEKSTHPRSRILRHDPDDDIPPTQFTNGGKWKNIGKLRQRISIPLRQFQRGGEVLKSDTVIEELSIQFDQTTGIFEVSKGEKNLDSFKFRNEDIAEALIENNGLRVIIRLGQTDNRFLHGNHIFWEMLPGAESELLRALASVKVQQRESSIMDIRVNRFSQYVRKTEAEERSPQHTSPYFPHTQPARKKPTVTYKETPAPRYSAIAPESFYVQPTRTTRSSAVSGLEFEEPPKPKDSFVQRSPRPPSWDTPLVWPPEGPKRVTVDYVDLDRLDEEQFLNDNIINFYLRYIEECVVKKSPELAQKTYFFNTFFYERLSKRTSDKKENLQGLLKWTSRVDLFSKSYVIVPINENAHWYLAIICNLNHLERKLQNKEVETPTQEAKITEPVAESEIGTESSGTPDEVNQQDHSPTELHTTILHRPVTAEEQILAEASIQETENSFDRMNIDEMANSEDSEWPNEDGLEGIDEPHGRVTGIGSLKAIVIDEENVDAKSKKIKKAVPKPKKVPKALDPDSPVIFILDSLNTTSHGRTFTFLREYLQAEAREKKNLTFSAKEAREVIKGSYPKVPEQPNFCDCGVYLLYYIERFLERPEEFTEEFLRREPNKNNNFDQSNISGMRNKLRRLILRLKKDPALGEVEPDKIANATDEDIRAGTPKGQETMHTPSATSDRSRSPEPGERRALTGSPLPAWAKSTPKSEDNDTAVPVKKYISPSPRNQVPGSSREATPGRKGQGSFTIEIPKQIPTESLTSVDDDSDIQMKDVSASEERSSTEVEPLHTIYDYVEDVIANSHP